MASRQQIVDSIAAVARKLGRTPSLVEFMATVKISRHEILQQFSTWNDAVLASGLQPHRQGRSVTRTKTPAIEARITYGNPIDLPALRHEPVNEQGVVLLFGMLARELGYVVEAAQKEFPDCEAKRQISPQRWERVRIEFEFESKNFLIHGHPLTGCDIIVCWQHNWPECPLEVVELSSLLRPQLATRSSP